LFKIVDLLSQFSVLVAGHREALHSKLKYFDEVMGQDLEHYFDI
jgi:hypothetical protein